MDNAYAEEPYAGDDQVIDEFEPITAPSVTASPTPVPTRSFLDPPTSTTSMSAGDKPWYDLFDSEKVSALTSSSDIMAAQEKRLADLEKGITGENDDPDQDEYDGPPKTGAQLGDIVRSMGLPTSFATIVDDVQDALIGTVQDLTNSTPTTQPTKTEAAGIDVTPNLSEPPPEKKGFMDILTRGNRLRGWGILFVSCAIIGVLVAMLLMPMMM